jgi:hypothetical protein
MSYVLADNAYIPESEQQDLYARCISSGKLVSGLLRTVTTKE